MDKATFIARLNDLVSSARKDVGQDALLDLRASRAPYQVNEDDYDCGIDNFEQLWDWLKDADEWYVDIYENVPEDKSAYYTGYAVTSWE